MSELARGSPKSSRTLLEFASKARKVLPSLMSSTLDSTKGLRNASGGFQGLSWGTPGRSWVALGVLLGCSWGALGVLLGDLGRSWGALGPQLFQKFAKKRKKTQNFVSSGLFGCSWASAERSGLDFWTLRESIFPLRRAIWAPSIVKLHRRIRQSHRMLPAACACQNLGRNCKIQAKSTQSF